MIQRIQSIFLLVVVLLAILFPFFSLGSLETALTKQLISASGSDVPNAGQLSWHVNILRWALWILPAVIVALTAYTILLYKKRLLQVRMGKANIMVHIVLLVVAFSYIDAIKSAVQHTDFSYGPAIFFPLLSLLLIFRANRSIIKDEGLVRAADRIR